MAAAGHTPQHVVGVAIAVPAPIDAELQAWRVRLGDPKALAIPPHVTLLPPTDVDDAQLQEVTDHLQKVADQCSSFELVLRGSGTFRPVSPVVFVQVADGISGCERLEGAVRSGPLARSVKFNYHPHVTVAHDVSDDLLDVGFAKLADFEASFRVGSFALYEHGADGVWRAVKTFAFPS